MKERQLINDSNPLYDVWEEEASFHDRIRVTRNKAGDYIGDIKTAWALCDERGIAPEKMSEDAEVCSIGFSEKEQKWYGWSHRAIYGFGIGHVTKKGDSATTSGWTDEYLSGHPEQDRRVPVGFEAKTLDDARRIAVAFAESVS